MSTDDTIPKRPRIGGLNPKAQKLQALRDKMEHEKNGGTKQNFNGGSTATSTGHIAAGHKKTNFQRKAT